MPETQDKRNISKLKINALVIKKMGSASTLLIPIPVQSFSGVVKASDQL